MIDSHNVIWKIQAYKAMPLCPSPTWMLKVQNWRNKIYFIICVQIVPLLWIVVCFHLVVIMRQCMVSHIVRYESDIATFYFKVSTLEWLWICTLSFENLLFWLLIILVIHRKKANWIMTWTQTHTFDKRTTFYSFRWDALSFEPTNSEHTVRLWIIVMCHWIYLL